MIEMRSLVIVFIHSSSKVLIDQRSDGSSGGAQVDQAAVPQIPQFPQSAEQALSSEQIIHHSSSY